MLKFIVGESCLMVYHTIDSSGLDSKKERYSLTGLKSSKVMHKEDDNTIKCYIGDFGR